MWQQAGPRYTPITVTDPGRPPERRIEAVLAVEAAIAGWRGAQLALRAEGYIL